MTGRVQPAPGTVRRRSQVEGVDDVAFEECDPAFFDRGMRVIGYPVDDGGELVVQDNGDLGGIIDAVLPFDDTDPAEMELEVRMEYEPLGLDLRYRPELDESTADYAIEGNTATGTLTLADVRGELTSVDFEITC